MKYSFLFWLNERKEMQPLSRWVAEGKNAMCQNINVPVTQIHTFRHLLYIHIHTAVDPHNLDLSLGLYAWESLKVWEQTSRTEARAVILCCPSINMCVFVLCMMHEDILNILSESATKLEWLHCSVQWAKHNNYESWLKLPFKGNKYEPFKCAVNVTHSNSHL